MGYKIAEAACKRHHLVTLVSGPTSIEAPKVTRFITIETTEDLLKTIKKELRSNNCLIMCAAVSDFRPARIFNKKIKRERGILLGLVPNKDLLFEVSRHKRNKLFIGFSLEAENLLRNSRLKLRNKKLDIIVANRLAKNHNPFGCNKLNGYIIEKDGPTTKIEQGSKEFVANVLLDKIEKMWYLRQRNRQNPKRQR